MHAPLATLYTRDVMSADAVTSLDPLALKLTSKTSSVWPLQKKGGALRGTIM